MKPIGKNTLTKKSRKRLWAIIIIAVIIVVGAGIFGAIKYHNSQANKIYSVGQAMKYPNFEVTLTKSQIKPVNLPLDKDVVTQYGGLVAADNCDTFSDQPIPFTALQQI